MYMKVTLGFLAGLVALGACATNPEANKPVAKSACEPVSAVVYFKSDSAAILDSTTGMIAQFANKVRECPDAAGGALAVNVMGFPDQFDMGAAAETLANARAEAVKAKLGESGLPPERVFVQKRDPAKAKPERVMRRRVQMVATFNAP